MILPADDYILLSVINTALRDEYSSFDELCSAEDADGLAICGRLSALGYFYDEKRNAFVAQ